MLQHSEGFWEVIELWRMTIGDAKYDDLILRLGSPYMRFVLTRDKGHLTSTMRDAVNTLMKNLDLVKTEGYFTDRVELRDMREGDSKISSFMEAMLLGASLNDASYPFNRVSWTGFDGIVLRARHTVIGYGSQPSLHSIMRRHQRMGGWSSRIALPGPIG